VNPEGVTEPFPGLQILDIQATDDVTYFLIQ
jgi:hypothetical protein